MPVRSRVNKDTSQASGSRDFKMADTPPPPNGNKVADVNMYNGLPYGKDSLITTNKVGDLSKSPSISSQDSCTKLTLDKKDDDVICCARESGTCYVLKLAVCFVCGIIFGMMFTYSRGE